MPATTAPGRRSVPVQQRSASKVEAILSTARDALSDPQAALSIRDLAAAAGLSVGTIYRYFESLEAIVHAALTEHARVAEAEITTLLRDADAGSLAELFSSVFEHFVRLYEQNPRFTTARFAGTYAERYAAIEEASNRRLAALLSATAIDAGLAPDNPQTTLRVLVHWNALGSALRMAYGEERTQADPVLAEARRMLEDFAASYG